MRWTLKPQPEKEKVEKLAKELQVNSTIASILCQRNIETFEDAKNYFRPNLKQIHDPFLMKDMDVAVSRIETAIANNENILISQLLTRNLVSVNENKTTYNAIKLLTTNNIGALPVLNDNMELSGIISERDIIREISNNLSVNFKKSNIKSIMTSKVITINKNTKSETIMDIMSKNKIRHIPIVENKLLIGIVSIGDVVKRLLEKFNLENQHLKSWLY